MTESYDKGITDFLQFYDHITWRPVARRWHKAQILWRCVQRVLLAPYIERIRALGVWGPVARSVPIRIHPHNPLLGMGEYVGNVIRVFATGKLRADLSTIIHEMAHADLWDQPSKSAHHGWPWRCRYMIAVSAFIGGEVRVDEADRLYLMGLDNHGYYLDREIEVIIHRYLENRRGSSSSERR